ncbi:MAG TPA: ATP-binding cassette domain-containing protein, partial [Chloroflexota bacterium]|nr:ATP-binding cassette domain-containing protein [Chloroflexota bacterium]
RFPSQISGGEQQRAAIARAIVRSPHILLADEPTANLPPDASWQIIQLLAEVNRRGVTTLVATHDRDVVDGMKRRVVEVADGRIVRDQRYGTFTPNGTSVTTSSAILPALTPTSSSAAFPVLPATGPSVLSGPQQRDVSPSGLYPSLAQGPARRAS